MRINILEGVLPDQLPGEDRITILVCWVPAADVQKMH